MPKLQRHEAFAEGASTLPGWARAAWAVLQRNGLGAFLSILLVGWLIVRFNTQLNGITTRLEAHTQTTGELAQQIKEDRESRQQEVANDRTARQQELTYLREMCILMAKLAKVDQRPCAAN